MKQETIIISGGGICGMACALAVSQAGHRAVVLEKASAFAAIGAGLQLGPNAVSALKSLGAWEAVAKICSSPDAVSMGDGRTGKSLRRMSFASFDQRYGAPYRVTHRADLHAALLKTVRGSMNIELILDQDVVGINQISGGVEVTTARGQVHCGSGLVVAEGVHSPLRRIIWPGARVIDSGMVFHRAPLVGVNDKSADVGLWMGPDMHVVEYAVGQPPQRNLICITRVGVYPSELVSQLAPEVGALLADVEVWTQWPGFYVEPMDNWSRGNCIVLGDAAHGTLPFLAQGAAMALEDAAWLKQALEFSSTIEDAFTAHGERRNRTARLHHASLRQVRIYHAVGAMALARNFAMRNAPDAIFQNQLQWIYQHKT